MENGSVRWRALIGVLIAFLTILIGWIEIATRDRWTGSQDRRAMDAVTMRLDRMEARQRSREILLYQNLEQRVRAMEGRDYENP